MRILNKHFNTEPFAFHAHGRPAITGWMTNTTPEGIYNGFDLQAAVLKEQSNETSGTFTGRKEAKGVPAYPAPVPREVMDNPLNEKLHLFTINNQQERGVAVRQMEHFGMDVTILGKDIVQYDHHFKIPILIKHIESIDKPYTMFMDADDIFFTTDPTNLVNTFESNLDCSMLCNADGWLFPKMGLQDPMRHFQMDIAKKTHEGSPYTFLNSGLWIADTNFLKSSFLPRLIALREAWDNDLPGKPYSDVDQALFHYIYQENYPRMKIDITQMYFQSYSWSAWLTEHYPNANKLEVILET